LPGVKATKIMKHLVEAQMPFSLNQLKRIDRSIKEVDVITKGRFDEYGQDYEFGPEFAGLFGFRAVELDPAKSLGFKIFDYINGQSDARKLFTNVTLKGGPIEPYEIVDAYINANRALFNVRKEMKNDFDAARLLGITEEELTASRKGRLTNKEFNNLDIGFFQPYKLSPGIYNKFQTDADKIRAKDPSYKNPMIGALNTVTAILSRLSILNLDDEFPFIENPLLPKPGGADAAKLPAGMNMPNIDTNLVSSQVQQTDSTNAQRFATLFPNG
jgi:hypothetical protein